MPIKTKLATAVLLASVPVAGLAQLEEVIVTASKRTESLQDVPIAVTSISGADITRVGANDFTDILTTVPSLSMRSAGPGRTKLNIRGVSAATGFAPTVSFYLDEMPIQSLSSGSSTSFQQTIIDPKLYDLDRIEVLRGPQGTLYGSSSMGGTVRLITAKPNPEEMEGSVNVDLSDTKEGDFNWRTNAMGNLPIGDNSALRVVGSYTDAEGFMDRVSLEDGSKFEDDVNNEETSTLRAAYRYEFENAYIQPSVLYQNTEMDGKPLYNGPDNEFEQLRKFDAEEPFEDEFTLTNLTYGHDFDGVDLLVSASYLDRDFDNDEDITDGYDDLLAEDLGIPSTEVLLAKERNEVEDTTIEARLSSTIDDFDWLVGLYYKDAETDSGYRMQQGFPLEVNAAGLANTQDKREYEEYAMFGELTYNFAEEFAVTVGARYLEYDISQFKEDWGLAFDGTESRQDAVVTDRDDDDNELHGKLTGTWQYEDQSQVYATVSNGTRPGGFNRTIPSSGPIGDACSDALDTLGTDRGSFEGFDGDEVTNYELGWKADVTDRLRINSAIYYIEWEDIQQVVTLPNPDCGVNPTVNLGDAESRGAELEILAQVIDNLTVSFAASYTDAELQDDGPEAGVESGDNLPDVPEWTANITLDYTYPINTGDLFFVANYNYVDDTLEFVGDANDDVSSQGVISGNEKPDYDILDLRIGFASDDNWELLFYVDNATDEEAIYSYSDALAFNLTTYDRTVRNRPRTYGTSFTYRF